MHLKFCHLYVLMKWTFIWGNAFVWISCQMINTSRTRMTISWTETHSPYLTLRNKTVTFQSAKKKGSETFHFRAAKMSQVIVATAVSMALANLINVMSVEHLVNLKFYLVQKTVDSKGVVDGIVVLMASGNFKKTANGWGATEGGLGLGDSPKTIDSNHQDDT